MLYIYKLESNFISNFQELLLTDLVFLNYLFTYYLFLAALGLPCCTWALSSCGHGGLLFVVACELLIAVAFSCCRAWALGHGLSS